jgi:hypothetical protein
LFSEGKTPLEVAIELNLKEPEATKYYREHWKLKRLHKLDLIYEDIKDDIVQIAKLHRRMKAADIGVEQVINLIKIANIAIPLFYVLLYKRFLIFTRANLETYLLPAWIFCIERSV